MTFQAMNTMINGTQLASSRSRRFGLRLLTHAVTLLALVTVWVVPAAAQSGPVFAVARYWTNGGGLDVNFNSSGTTSTIGRAITDVTSSSWEQVHAVAPYPGGKVVVAGCAMIANVPKFVVARYKTDGRLDTTFNGTGIAIAAFTNGCPVAVAVQPDGKVVVAGNSKNAGINGIQTVRYTATGRLDTTYGNSANAGRVWFTFASATVQYANNLALQPDGKIIVIGQVTISGGARFALARLTASGSLDSTFGSGGKRVTNFTASSGEEAVAVTLQPDRKILVGGWADSQYALARYLPNGALDTAFGGGAGMVRSNVTIATGESILALRVRADGKIMAAGRSNNRRQMTLARYSTNGTLEAVVTNDFAPAPTQVWSLHSIAFAPDGVIYAAGAGPGNVATLAKYNSGGGRGTGFGAPGQNGTVRTSFRHPSGTTTGTWFNAVAVDPVSGRVIGGGATSAEQGWN